MYTQYALDMQNQADNTKYIFNSVPTSKPVHKQESVLPIPTVQPGYKLFTDRYRRIGFSYPTKYKLDGTEGNVVYISSLFFRMQGYIIPDKTFLWTKDEVLNQYYSPCNAIGPSGIIMCKNVTIEDYTTPTGYKGFRLQRLLTHSGPSGEEKWQDTIYAFPIKDPDSNYRILITFLMEDNPRLDILESIAGTFFNY